MSYENRDELIIEPTAPSENETNLTDEENITRLMYDDKELILIGTAHVSQKSAEQVQRVIEREQPDTVCVELDQARYYSITQQKQWQQTDIFKIIKDKKAALLLVNLIISSFQKRIAKQFGIKPGQEMIQAIESAKANQAKLVLADRDIQITFKRVWRSIGFIGKMKLMMQILLGFFYDEEISESDLEKLKSKDMLSAMLDEFTEAFPRLKVPLIDERDKYLSQKIKKAPGEKIVAVLGAAHIPGIVEQINYEHNLNELVTLPPKSRWPRLIPWLIPLLIISVIGYTFAVNRDVGIAQSISWILWNGSFSALGALLAFAHPLTILAAFLAAPLSSMNPLLAAGWIAGLIEALLRRPSVEHFEKLGEDVLSLKGFWRNRVTRVLLVVVLTNIGSTIGTFIGGTDVLRKFFEVIAG